MHESDINAKNNFLKGSRAKCYNYKQLVVMLFSVLQWKQVKNYVIILDLIRASEDSIMFLLFLQDIYEVIIWKLKKIHGEQS